RVDGQTQAVASVQHPRVQALGSGVLGRGVGPPGRGPLIANDRGTRLSKQTVEWFAAAGERPSARIELNFNDAMKSLVAAGYGAALLPHEAGAPAPDARIVMRPLKPASHRALGIAHRVLVDDRAVEAVLEALLAMREG
ncbi:MAG: LysR family transcriptional regulator substrate-binding protein, partial [Rubrivivax sp.]